MKYFINPTPSKLSVRAQHMLSSAVYYENAAADCRRVAKAVSKAVMAPSVLRDLDESANHYDAKATEYMNKALEMEANEKEMEANEN